MAIFSYMDGLENKYLQKVNLEALQKETGMTLAELASLAQIGPKVIYKWRYMHKDSSRPDYNTIIRLLEKGATVETLFGIEYKGRPCNPIVLDETQFSPQMRELFRHPEFVSGMEKALADVEAKKKGSI